MRNDDNGRVLFGLNTTTVATIGGAIALLVLGAGVAAIVIVWRKKSVATNPEPEDKSDADETGKRADVRMTQASMASDNTPAPEYGCVGSAGAMRGHGGGRGRRGRSQRRSRSRTRRSRSPASPQ